MLELIDIITNSVTYNTEAIQMLFIKILEDRSLYIRYFFNNTLILKSFFQMLLIKLTQDVKYHEELENNKKTVTMLKHNCNHLILEVIIKLVQNIVLDLEAKLMINKDTTDQKGLKIKTKDLDSSNQTNTNTINNQIEMSFKGYKFLKPRQTILQSIDYEKEIESEEEDSDEESVKLLTKDFSKRLNLEDESEKEWLFILLSKVLNFLTLNFNSIAFKTLLNFGIENIKKLEFFNIFLEVHILFNFINFIDSKPHATLKNEDISKLNDLDNLDNSFEFDDYVNKYNKLHILTKDQIITFIDQSINSFFNFQNNSMLHKEVEFLVTFLSSRYCPLEITMCVFNESNLFSMFCKANINITKIPMNISNQCEIISRIFITEIKQLQLIIEKSNFLLKTPKYVSGMSIFIILFTKK